MIQVAVIDGLYRCYETSDGIRRRYLSCSHSTPREAIAHSDRAVGEPLPGREARALYDVLATPREEPRQPVSPAERDAIRARNRVASAGTLRGAPLGSWGDGPRGFSVTSGALVKGQPGAPLPTAATARSAQIIPAAGAFPEAVSRTTSEPSGPPRPALALAVEDRLPAPVPVTDIRAVAGRPGPLSLGL